MPLKRWKVDAGNSTKGTVGFVLYDIFARSQKEALAKAKAQLPEATSCSVASRDGKALLLRVYFNPQALTLRDIEED